MRSIAIAVLLSACTSANAAPPRVVDLPGGDLQRLSGGASSFKTALGGSVAVIDLWATWCAACERERPKLARLDLAYRSQGLRVIGLNVGEAPSVVSDYLAQNSISYPVYLDPDFQIADALGDKQLPTLLVIDRHGRIAHRAPALDDSTLALVKALLGAPD